MTALSQSSRTQVAIGFLYSSEHLTTVVDGYYVDLLDRGIDPTGAASWVSAIQGGARDEQIIAGLVASDEYRSKVHASTVLPCSPSAGAAAYDEVVVDTPSYVVHHPAVEETVTIVKHPATTRVVHHDFHSSYDRRVPGSFTGSTR